ncbi:MAG: tyrosine-type recombinase/integrase [Clostridia bacterium]|nr:tyrosine-type recombinase/integrase [Clostridia bacterium]
MDRIFMEVYYMNITKELINEFEKELVKKEKSPATVEKYVRDVEAFSDYAVYDIPPKPCLAESGIADESENRHVTVTVTKQTVIAYKAYLTEHYAARSVNSMLASLNAFFTFTGNTELKVKSLKLQHEIFCPEEKELTKAEYLRLVNTAEKSNKRLSLIIQTICGTGIRVSELQYITVEAVKHGEADVNCKGKTRTVFIVKELKRKLLKYINERKIKTGSVFVTKNGRPVSRSNIWREMKAICKAANVNPSKVFPHNLRHLFARVFYAIEKDIAKLADILGHSSINTTRIYIVSTGDEHRRRMEKMKLVI